MSAYQIFTMWLIASAFFGLGITLFTYSLPSENINYISDYSSVATNLDLNNVSARIESTTQSTLNVPLIELGALVFYSGNIIVDLLLNSIFAPAQMIGLLLSGFAMLFSVDNNIMNIINGFLMAITVVLYLLSIIQLLTNIRSQSNVV